jgi:uncharacterized protein (TIGR00255 family)
MTVDVQAIRSMTGFGRAEGGIGSIRAAVEVHSLNHRNREVLIYLPPRWSRFDPSVRSLVAQHVRRGKVRISFRIPDEGTGGPIGYVFRPEVLDVYLKAYGQVCKQLGEEPKSDPWKFLTARGVVSPVDAVEGDPSSEEGPELEALLGQAMSKLMSSREREGAALRIDLEERLEAMRRILTEVEERIPVVRERLQTRFRTRIEELLEGKSFPEDRVLTEAAFYVDRGDVHEELVRFHAHVEEFAKTMSQGGGCGRRLAFLGQEMNRESNTLGAKSVDPECSRLVVHLKDEVAKVREQVENLE